MKIVYNQKSNATQNQEPPRQNLAHKIGKIFYNMSSSENHQGKKYAHEAPEYAELEVHQASLLPNYEIAGLKKAKISFENVVGNHLPQKSISSAVWVSWTGHQGELPPARERYGREPVSYYHWKLWKVI